MNFEALFDEDLHVATEDAYVRIMKCRKWVAPAAVGYYLTHGTLIGPQPFTIVVAKVGIPLSELQAGTLASLIYIGCQYALLFVQYLDRFPSLSDARHGRREFERVLELRAERRNLEEQKRSEFGSGSLMQSQHALDHIINTIARIDLELGRLDPNARPSAVYRFTDFLMDAARIAAPVIVVVFALIASVQN